MFGIFGRKPPAEPTLDSVGFDTTGYEPRGEPIPGHLRAWWTPDRDGLGLYLFSLPPDLPQTYKLTELRGYYETMMRAAGGTIVEVSTLGCDNRGAIRTIAKVPQASSGFTYIGSLTIPFRAFSFVLKVQCEERGPTGLREAVLTDRQLAAGGALGPLTVDADDESFDPGFAQHPVSRVRRALDHITRTARVDAPIKALPDFALPSGTVR